MNNFSNKELKLKITLLYFLKILESPVKESIIINFFLKKEYSDFFTLKQVIIDLHKNELIQINKNDKENIIEITEKGITTYEYFNNRVSKQFLDSFYQEVNNKKEIIKKNIELKYELKNLEDEKYTINLSLYKYQQIVFNLKLVLDSKSKSEEIINRFKTNPINFIENLKTNI